MVQVIEFIEDKEIYERVILQRIPKASSYLWLATSDLKDLHVHKGRKMVPFLEIIADLIENGVFVRLVHAKEPGPAFRADFDRYPVLIEGLERLLCPRVHFKTVVIDGKWAYTGSANLTGAGMGAKSPKRRNFENGFVTDEPGLVDSIMSQFDSVWMGLHCGTCGRADYCADRKDLI
ncbi:MAG: phospholipase D family protein [Chitinispirillaceae bacterium]